MNELIVSRYKGYKYIKHEEDETTITLTIEPESISCTCPNCKQTSFYEKVKLKRTFTDLSYKNKM